MGSATSQALRAVADTLQASPDVDLTVADELFAAARALGGSPQLSGALTDWSAPAAARAKVVADVFGSLSRTTVALITAAAQQRWSSSADVVDGVEELAIRAAAKAEPHADVDSELFEFGRTVAANPELELALGSRLGQASAKADLVASLLRGRVSDAAILIAASLVRAPRERRVRELLARAEKLVSAQRGRMLATVTSAVPLTDAQTERLSALLGRRYGSDVAINRIVDPSVIGGLRVRVADDVIDASLQSRLADLRLRIAG